MTFTSGSATLLISDTVPENVSLSLNDVDSTGLVMSATAMAAFYAGPTAQLRFLTVPSQMFASSGSLVVVQCLDAYGNVAVVGCGGSVSIAFNSTHMSPPTGALMQLGAYQLGLGAITLTDSVVEAVLLRLSDSSHLGYVMTSTAVLYSTSAPYQLTAQSSLAVNG